MKTIKSYIISLVLLSVGVLAQAEISIIANKDLNMPATDVNDVFTGEKTSIAGIKLVLSNNKAALDEFCQKVLKTDAGKYASGWAKKSFRDGIPTPKEKANDAEAIEFVKSTPGGVSFITGAAPADVKVISKF